MNDVQRVRMFCGPNGSGKTTLLRSLACSETGGQPLDIGVIVNADDMLKEMSDTQRLDLTAWGIPIDIEALCNNVAGHALVQKAAVPCPRFTLQNGVLHVEGPLNAYHAAALADHLRGRLLEAGASFTFETVMSHESKVRFLEEARSRGCRTSVYWVTTAAPIINVSRVFERVQQGGHDVATDKITFRYHAAHRLLPRALHSAHRGYLFDNSETAHRLVAAWDQGRLTWVEDDPPAWIEELRESLGT